jgi:hypothetical protein
MLRRLYVNHATARVSGRSVQFSGPAAPQAWRDFQSVRWTVALALAAALTACGGGDSGPSPAIHQTVATTTYAGSSGKTHVNDVDAIALEAESTVTITVTGDFSTPAGAPGLIYSRFSPAWSVNGGAWTLGAGSPALQEIRVDNTPGAEYRAALRATYSLTLPAGTTVAAGIYFVDHVTAQLPGSLANARTVVEVKATR